MVITPKTFETGQVWASPDGKEIFLLIEHHECGCIIQRLLFLKSHGKIAYRLGLPIDDFDRNYYTEHKYRCVGSLRKYFGGSK